MDEVSYISVKGAEGRYNDFVRFMNATAAELKTSAETGKVDFSKHQGEKLEWVVLDQMKELACQFNFNAGNINTYRKTTFSRYYIRELFWS